ncbi:hypothetical protein SLS60_009202 [Paraconiothyrium brasiliense]|uniref:Macro domain-like protein n=1 Tax=Paraconiothyrium brasiliense TaxID=300254 RepID=A0ABR3QWM2_9PLEO
MGAEQLSSVMEAVGKKVDPDLKARIERESEATFGSARLWDDGIIPPEHTRRVLGMGLQMAQGGQNLGVERESKWGVFRILTQLQNMAKPVPSPPPMPSFHILWIEEIYITAFESARHTYNLPTSISITYQRGTLASLPQHVQFDAIVSPANSYARMDGGFDDALSRAFSPENDYLALTRVVQEALYKEHRGFLAPGSCMLVSLDDEKLRGSTETWGCKWLALCPTMKVPQRVDWDREVVYECVWALLAAVDRHNVSVNDGDGKSETKVQNLLMTPLATGYGRWSAERWAAQTVLGMKHFVEAARAGDKWTVMGPTRVMGHAGEVEKTWEL